MKKFIFSFPALLLILAFSGCAGTKTAAESGVDAGHAKIAAIPAD